MPMLADQSLELSSEEQAAFNLARWAELTADPRWEQWEGRIETDEYGNAIMMPPLHVSHGRAEVQIALLLQQLLGGVALTECPISTTKGVKSADIAWMTAEAYEKVQDELCLPAAPPLCIEVISPSNSPRELTQKRALYFQAGAVEVWFCSREGRMTFFLSPDDAGRQASAFCPSFPATIGR